MVSEGMYRKDSIIYKVQKAVHGSGRLYAKALIDGRFEYASGMVYKLAPSDQMTLEEAKEFGALYGICCVCGRLLTDETSIEAGIGPICAGRSDYFATDAKRVELYIAERTPEAPEAPVEVAPVRTVTLESNKYGPVFALRFDFNAEIKDEIKSWDWNRTKRTWNPDLKAWTVSADGQSLTKVIDLRDRFGFVFTPEVQAKLDALAFEPVSPAPSFKPVSDTPKQSELPLKFSDLLKEV